MGHQLWVPNFGYNKEQQPAVIIDQVVVATRIEAEKGQEAGIGDDNQQVEKKQKLNSNVSPSSQLVITIRMLKKMDKGNVLPTADARNEGLVDKVRYQNMQQHNCKVSNSMSKFEPVNDNLAKKCTCPYERPTLRTEDYSEKKLQQQKQQLMAANSGSNNNSSSNSSIEECLTNAEDIRNANANPTSNQLTMATSNNSNNNPSSNSNNSKKYQNDDNNNSGSANNHLICDSDSRNNKNSSSSKNRNNNSIKTSLNQMQLLPSSDDDVRNNNKNASNSNNGNGSESVVVGQQGVRLYPNDRTTVIISNHNNSSGNNKNSASVNLNNINSDNCVVLRDSAGTTSSPNSSFNHHQQQQQQQPQQIIKFPNEGILSNCLSALNFVSGGNRNSSSNQQQQVSKMSPSSMTSNRSDAGSSMTAPQPIEGQQQKPLCDHCCKKKSGSSGKSAKLCKNCRLHNCSVQNCKDNGNVTTTKSKRGNWSLRFNCAKLKGSSKSSSNSSKSNELCSCSSSVADKSKSVVKATVSSPSSLSPSSSSSTVSSQPMALTPENLHRFIGEQALMQQNINNNSSSNGSGSEQIVQRLDSGHNGLIVLSMNQSGPLLDFSRFNPDDYPTEDCDERLRVQREKEIEDGIEVPLGYLPKKKMNMIQNSVQDNQQVSSSSEVSGGGGGAANQQNGGVSLQVQQQWPHMICAPFDLETMIHNHSLQLQAMNNGHQMPVNVITLEGSVSPPRIHSQVDYIHCLVPDLQKITSCGFYWGKMDRYQAEKLLDGKPEGTFLLRDSAQEEFLFSVSFRKYGRSLHARIEQFNHKFSFDSHDPGVYTAMTVTGLLEHYKDPSCVMFFEPMLTHPLNRNFCFSLQQLCRATIVSNTTYDNISEFTLPPMLKAYLKEYHYKQKVRVKGFDEMVPNPIISS